jgi:hypothetical protein
MDERVKAELVKEIVNAVIIGLEERRTCPCGLQDKRMSEHDDHHRFIAELIDFLKTAKRSALQAFIVTVVGTVLTLLWLGFSIKTGR